MPSDKKKSSHLSAQVLSSLVLFNQMTALPALASGQGHTPIAGAAPQFSGHGAHAFTPAASGWQNAHTGGQQLPASFGMGVTSLTSQSLPLPQSTASHAPFMASGHNFQAHQGSQQSKFHSQLTAPSVPAQSVQLDLTSASSTVVLDASTVRNGSVMIDVGGAKTTFHVGDKVTAAELVAIEQAQVRGGQTIKLDDQGRATGGTFSLNSITNAAGLNITSVVVPNNVTAIDKVGAHSNINLSGDLINYGSIVEVGRHAGSLANITAQDIINQVGGLITTKAAADLNLTAIDDFTNMGTISSAGALSITAGGTLNNIAAPGTAGAAMPLISAHNSVTLQAPNVVNNGTISSATGNINLGVAGDQSVAMNINNTGGTLSALQGAINVRDAGYAGTGNTTLVGGNLLSQELNLNSGAGSIDVSVKELTGTVNSQGEAVHVHAATDNLVIGKQCLVGDPTYYNDSGDITIDGNINVGEDLTIIAFGDVIATNNLTSITANDGTSGKNITIVAGANVTGAGGDTTNTISNTPPVTGNAQSDVAFSGASTTGGDVNFTKAGFPLVIDASAPGTGNAGNIILAAYNDATNSTAKGSVNMSSIASMNATASTGTPGNVTILAGSPTNSSFLGKINAQDVTISTSQPGLQNAGSITFDTTGAVSNGNQIVRDYSAPLNNVTATMAGNVNATGNVNVSAGYAYVGGSTVSTTKGSIVMTSLSKVDVAGTVQTTAGGNILLVAGTDVATASGAVISTQTTAAAVKSGDITLVAGAAFSETSDSLSITGPSISGGEVNLVNAAGGGHGPISQLSSSASGNGSNGGNITLVAFADQANATSNGSVIVPNAVTITTGGGINGGNGGVIVVANNPTNAIGTATDKLNIDTTGGFSTTGNITLSASMPGTPLYSLPTAITDPNAYLIGTQVNSNINFGALNTSSAYITLVEGGPFVIPTNLPTNSNLVFASAGDLTVPAPGYSSNHSIALLSGANIFLAGNLQAEGGIAMAAAGNISSTAGVAISTATNSQNSGSMSIAAGVIYEVQLNQISIVGASPTGGNIDFKTTPIIVLSTATSNFGLLSGSMTLTAFADNTGLTGGHISLPSALPVNVSAFDTKGGDFVAIGSAKSGVAVDIGDVNSTSQNGANTSGAITLEAITPTTSKAAMYVFGLNGSLVSGLPTNFTDAAATLADIHAGTLTSLAGSITVFGGANYQIAALQAQGRKDIGTGGNTNGLGGTISVTNFSQTNDLNIGANSGGNYITNVQANGVAGGGISANGGTVGIALNGSSKAIVISNANALQFDATSAQSGKGGNLTLSDVGGTIDLGPLTSLNSTGNGAPLGGAISLTANNFTWNGKGSGTPLTITTSGTLAAGDIFVENKGTTVYSIGPASSKTSDFTLIAKGGNANVSYISGNAAVNVDGTGIDLTASGVVQGSHLVITALGIHNASGPIVLDASNSDGSGGTIAITDTAHEDVVIGNSNGGFILTAQGGKSGTGGQVTVIASDNLTVDPAQIKVGTTNPAAGTFGGLIYLSAGSALLVNGNISMTEGNLTLISNSATPFSIGGTKLINGITGTITVGTDKLSAIAVQNLDGGVISNDFLDAKNIGIEGDGPVTINAGIGSGSTANVSLVSSNGGAVTATKAPIQTLNADFLSDTGAITVSKLNASSFSAQSNKTAKTAVVAITNINTASVKITSAQGAKITIITPGNLTSSGQISGGPVTLTSSGKAGSGTSINLSGDVNSTGLVTITAPGAITFSGNLNGDLGVKVTNKDSGNDITFAGNHTLNALSSSTITITSGAGSIIQSSATDMNGAKSITLTASKGSITLGGAGNSGTDPLAIAASSLKGITVVGPISATNSVTLKATSTAANDGTIDLQNGIVTTSAKGAIAMTSGSGSTITSANEPFFLTFQSNAITLTGAAGVSMAGTQLTSGTKAVTVASAKGSVQVESITSIGANVAISALNTIDLNGSIGAATNVAVKSTNTKATADITVRAGITAGTAGSITLTAPTGSKVANGAFPTLKAGTVTIVGPAGINFNGATLQSTSKSIALTAAKGDVQLGVFSKVDAATSLTISSLNGLTSSAPVQAVTGITVTASDKVNGNVTLTNSFKTTGSGSKMTITANGTKGFSSPGGTLESDGALTIKAAAGPVSTSGGIQSDNGSVTLTGVDYDGTGGSINAGTTVAITGTGKTAANFVTVGNTVTTNGGITIKGAGGSITTTTNSLIKAQAQPSSDKTKVKILINDTNTKDGKITIDGFVWTVAQDATKANGGITIAVGTAPTAGKNPIATGDIANIAVTHLGSSPTGQVFGGVTAKTGGIVGTAPTANLTTMEAANVILNTPSALNPITFTANAAVTADPPPATTSAIAIGPLVHTTAITSLTAPQALPAGSQNSAIQISAPAATPQMNTVATAVTQPSTLLGGVTIYQLGNGIAFRDGSSRRSAYGSSIGYGSATAWISDTELAGGKIPATLHKIAGETVLDGGSLLVAADSDCVIKTAAGKVSIKAKSLVLVMTFSGGVGVYNLHDTCKNAVQLAAGGQVLTIQPGKSAVVVSGQDRRFEEINPAQLICYGALNETKLADELKLFHGEFSLPSAINAVPTLRSLIISNNATDKKLGDQFLKTTSIMLQLRNNTSQYRQMLKPRLTAYGR